MPEIRKLKWKKMTRTETSKNSNGKKPKQGKSSAVQISVMSVRRAPEDTRTRNVSRFERKNEGVMDGKSGSKVRRNRCWSRGSLHVRLVTARVVACVGQVHVACGIQAAYRRTRLTFGSTLTSASASLPRWPGRSATTRRTSCTTSCTPSPTWSSSASTRLHPPLPRRAPGPTARLRRCGTWRVAEG